MNQLRQLYSFLQERLGLEDLQRLAGKKRVPIHGSTHFYYLGGMALFLFMIQIVTGILLSLYYKPSPDQAFESVRAIVTEVDFGWLIRSAHSWSANLLVGILLLHLLTAYLMRAYRRPREMTWLTGVLLLGLFMAFGFSGYLLPWNELAFSLPASEPRSWVSCRSLAMTCCCWPAAAKTSRATRWLASTLCTSWCFRWRHSAC